MYYNSNTVSKLSVACTSETGISKLSGNPCNLAASRGVSFARVLVFLSD
ncbi:hypothetical protein [Candidatus Liberibacter asiaticus]|uniref:Uncharacterized protein n=2 Tax=Liberibacter asiaticus TaxID=34021 RepID=C6XF39_LIBAP|nr:hypothetical protein CLIBASIA_02025 [Candidatus Liberibacter asiaticus str. psy62]AGH17043.1 hypothetical protein WSI_03365 [Candidatus Liberibacter asiaticus str. gxpsy]KAE9509991.1 hypothetical protein FXW22_03360 [Candidatus Liberibacter asiaticus]BAP26563.1 hypothetical protein CGUJ_02025 [Candidatus Liberibacter asiaticus str. Ishi-1]KAE9512120.1 hypothetical protein FXW32_03360 [Candidatus Liberibacter asiaticus]